jgi:uncharacterized protein (DUF2236 family)
MTRLGPITGVYRTAFDAVLRQAMGPQAPMDRPAGDPGLFGPGSVAWQVHANPVVLAVGGVAAVILQLGEPAIRTAIWTRSSFRAQPLARMRRTAQAALVTTFAPTAAARDCIAAVGRMHAAINGVTPGGAAYSALDPELCDIVHLTTGHGFLSAYVGLVRPDLPARERDRYWAEGVEVGRAFGAGGPPTSAAQAAERLAALRDRLTPDPAIGEFLAIVARTSPLGPAGLPVQALLVEGALALTPGWARARLGLQHRPARQAAALGVLSLLARSVPPPAIVREAYQRMGVGSP